MELHAVERVLLTLSGGLGLLGVACGAFGAHGLRARFADLADGAERLGWWQTAAQYHLVHALAVAAAAYLASRGPASLAAWVGGCFALGVLLFSGSLYAMALGGPRSLGAVTPLGGLLFLAGWALLAIGALRLR
jgi:uncharacterized membrane protein YgdD (TMEM256/DUF423 family)